MANRDTTNFRRVTDVASSSGLGEGLTAIADFAQGIIQQNEAAKITEGLSRAQLDLSKMQMEYQTANQSDPMGGIKAYQQARDTLLEDYGKKINPMYRRQWNDAARQLSFKDEASQQLWAINQTKNNTVSSINRTMEADYIQAGLDGQRFGNSQEATADAALNFQASLDRLQAFGAAQLGEETTRDMLAGYKSDYTKSFLSGLAETNPAKALALMDDETVQKQFSNPSQYMSMKHSIENRALNISEIAKQREVLSVIKAENKLFNSKEPISYVQLQNIFDRHNISEPARDYFLRVNGYSKPSSGSSGVGATASEEFKAAQELANSVRNAAGSGSDEVRQMIYDGLDNKTITKAQASKLVDVLDNGVEAESINLTNAEKSAYQSALYDDVVRFSKQEQVSFADFDGFKNRIYEGLNNGSLTDKEAQKYLDAVVSPMVSKKEKELEDFQVNSWFFGEDNGYSQIDDHVRTLWPEIPSEDAPEYQLYLRDKLAMMRGYDDALEAEANKRDMSVADLMVADIQKVERRKIYSDAATSAKMSFIKNKVKQLEYIDKPENMPNKILRSDGSSIRTGLGKPDTVSPAVGERIIIRKSKYDGKDYRIRIKQDGTYEKLGVVE